MDNKVSRTIPRMAIVIGGVGMVVLLIAFALYALTGEVPPGALRTWAVVATLLAVPLFAAGFYFGKVEARGVLHGFDQSLDRISGVIGDVVTMRDQSRISVHNATKIPPNYSVVLPGVHDLPPITHRGAIDAGRETIEL